MTWTLLHHPSSPGSRKVRVALLELGVEYQVELESYWLRRPEFSNLNVACEVPVLLPDNADPVIGDLAICEFLDEVKPDRTLLGPSLEQQLLRRRSDSRDSGFVLPGKRDSARLLPLVATLGGPPALHLG